MSEPAVPFRLPMNIMGHWAKNLAGGFPQKGLSLFLRGQVMTCHLYIPGQNLVQLHSSFPGVKADLDFRQFPEA
jgi:hypothetical protein